MALLVGALVLVTGSVLWFSRAHTQPPRPAIRAASPPAGPAASSSTAPSRVFVIVLENRGYDQALKSPYLAGLAQQYALLTNYHAITSPSLPNYLALTSGSTWGIHDDAYRELPAGGLGDQLTAGRVSWKAYAEGFTGNCVTSPYPYAVKHNPFAFYGGACPSNIVPMTSLSADLAAGPPRLTWLIPGLCNDGHDCPSSTVDAWLQSVVPSILVTPAWRGGGALFITFDEDSGSSGEHVATLVIAPNLQTHTSATAYNHYSLLATIEDRLGVARLGAAQPATPITDVFSAG